MRWANLNSTCSPTNSPLPDSYLIFPIPRSTVAPHPPNACPASKKLCHPQSKPPPGRFSAWLVTLGVAPRPASPRRPTAHPPPNDAAIDACGEHCREPTAQPSVRHSCVLPAATIRCSNSAVECVDRRAPRRPPGPRHMPRSASAVGLARRGVIPRKQFYTKLFFFNTVILDAQTAAHLTQDAFWEISFGAGLATRPRRVCPEQAANSPPTRTTRCRTGATIPRMIVIPTSPNCPHK